MMYNMPRIDMIATGRNIECLRQEAGLSVRDLQGIFGFSTPQAIYKWQYGTALPKVDNLVVLAVLFKVPVDKIIVLEKDEAPVLAQDDDLKAVPALEDLRTGLAAHDFRSIA